MNSSCDFDLRQNDNEGKEFALSKSQIYEDYLGSHNTHFTSLTGH